MVRFPFPVSAGTVGQTTCDSVWKQISEVTSGLTARVTVISADCPWLGDGGSFWRSGPSVNGIIEDLAPGNATALPWPPAPAEFLSPFSLCFTQLNSEFFPAVSLRPS